MKFLVTTNFLIKNMFISSFQTLFLKTPFFPSFSDFMVTLKIHSQFLIIVLIIEISSSKYIYKKFLGNFLFIIAYNSSEYFLLKKNCRQN